MRILGLGLAALALFACAPKEAAPASSGPEQASSGPSAPAPPSGGAAGPGAFTPPAAADPGLAAACTNALKGRGVKENELWLMAHTPDGICPNNGVTEARIREILDKDWEAAGCRQYSKAEMLKALDSGACGGNAG